MNKQEAEKVLSIYPVREWDWPKICVGVLHERAMSYADKVFPRFWGIAQQGVPLLTQSYGRTDVIRNKMAVQFLKSYFTHLIMLDVDHMHPTDIVQRFARWVLRDPGVQIVGGLNFRRGEPYDPCCFVLGDNGSYYTPVDWDQGLVEVDALGTGSIMIAREVFEMIEPPWFYNDYSKVWEDEWPGEDMGFCEKCRASGIKMWVDTTTTSPHMIDAFVDEGCFRTYNADHNDKDLVTRQEVKGTS